MPRQHDEGRDLETSDTRPRSAESFGSLPRTAVAAVVPSANMIFGRIAAISASSQGLRQCMDEGPDEAEVFSNF